MKNTVSAGIRASVPIAAGYIPVAITFGLLARGAGLSTIDASAASLIVFAGAAQFMAVGMFAQGIATTQIVVATFLLNLRHLLMSSVIIQRLPPPTRRQRFTLAFGITDEVFAVATGDERVHPRYLAGLELGAYLAWNAGTVAGALAGDILPVVVQNAMGFALYALFFALLLSHLDDDRRLLVPAATAALVNIGLRYGLDVGPGAAFPAAMLAGTAAGFLTQEPATPHAGNEEAP